MPFLSYLEEDAIKKGEQRGRITSQLLILEPLLQARFGEHGLLLMPRIRCINDFDRLLQITLAIIANKDLSEITQLIPE